MPRFASLGLGVAIAVAIASRSAHGEALTIDEVLRLAEERSPTVRAAGGRVTAAAGRRTTASALLPNPEIEVALETDALTTREGESTLDVTLQQELLVFGQRGLRLDVADAELAAARLDAEAARLQARTTAAAAFYELMYEERRVVATRAVVEQAEKLAEAGERRLAAGDIAEVDATLLLADRADARAEAEEVAIAVRAAQTRLALAIGATDPSSLTTAGDFPSAAEPPDATMLIERAAQRPDVRALVQDAKAREREVALARRERLPVPVLALGFLRERAGFHAENFAPGVVVEEFETDYFLGVRLSFALPVFQTGRGAVDEARGRRIEAEARRDEIRLRAAAEVVEARARVESSRRKVAEYAAIEERLAAALALYEKALTAGQLDLATYLAARDRVLRATFNALAARRDAAVAAIELERAAGGGTR